MFGFGRSAEPPKSDKDRVSGSRRGVQTDLFALVRCPSAASAGSRRRMEPRPCPVCAG